MKPIIKRNPTLFIYPAVKKKMDYLVELSDIEIAWHGFVKRIAPDKYAWYDIVMYPQYNTSVTSVSEDEEYTQWLIKMMELDNFEDIRIHGHSHVRMSCTPSGTDMTFRQNILANIRDNDYYFFLIANKRGDYTLEFYDYDSKMCYDKNDITIVIGTEDEFEEARKWAKVEIEENVKERTYTCSTTSNPKNFSTQKDAQDPCTLSDVVPWEDPLQRFLSEPD